MKFDRKEVEKLCKSCVNDPMDPDIDNDCDDCINGCEYLETRIHQLERENQELVDQIAESRKGFINAETRNAREVFCG